MRKTKLAELGTSIEEVAKFNIKKGSFIIYTKAGKEIKTPIKNMRGCVREACDYCYDFAAEFADISVGSIGSEFGWSTVITRTDAAKDLVKRAKKAGVIEMKKLSKEQVKAVRKLASYKKRGNLKNIYEKAEPIRILNMQLDPELLEAFLGGE
ncbi:MAG: Coenzyme F420 hydrogenase/dehydrogenase, beta subunit C-terminal domain [Proteobacteria bacterium]|nr:Coenzyme F420 hydrogenase/dehydrogenase, beta subunit C-terminal domain [Pseudomonadota bacterium]